MSVELRAKQLDLSDLCCEVSPQEELHERHEELSPPRLTDVKRCPFVAEVLRPAQLTREPSRSRLVSHLEQLLFVLQWCRDLEELVEEVREEF